MAGSADFPYTPMPGSLKRILEKVPSVGRPDKVDRQWLTQLGFGGGNNAMAVPLLKQVAILDKDGAPTDLWMAIRAKDRAKVADGIRAAYAALFSMYPDAHRQDDEALMAFARARTDYAAPTAQKAIQTFKALVAFGDFETASGDSGKGGDSTPKPADEQMTPERGGGGDVKGRGGGGQKNQSAVGLTVNIQLQLPPSTDGAVYDQLFAAMARHLKGLITLE